MESVARRWMTAEDYCQLPETGPRYQLVKGELVMSPSPSRYHQQVAGNLEFLLRRYLQERPLGVLYDAPLDVFLGEHNVFQPDILFVSHDRRGILSKRGIEGAPNVVIEVLSPSTRHLDLGAKKAVYGEAGVEEMWVVDPDARTLAVYRLAENPQAAFRVLGVGEPLESECLPGLKLNLSEVFAEGA